MVLGLVVALFWLPGLAFALLAIPFLYIALVLSLTSHRLGPRGGDFQRRTHQLLIDSVGNTGRLLDVGCGSGQLLIRFDKSSPGEYIGLDYWGADWEYSRSQSERNAELEDVQEILELRFPLNLAKVLKYAVLISGTKSLAAKR